MPFGIFPVAQLPLSIIMLIKIILSVVLLALGTMAIAAQPPGAGSQIQQIPPVPVPQKLAPTIDLEQGNPLAIPAPDSVKILVNRLKITGAYAYTEQALLAVTGFKPGSELSLPRLRGMALKIADYYHRNGYFVAVAYLPAQEIQGSSVTIAVLEGQYGKVTLLNQANLSDALALSVLNSLNSGDIIVSGILENRLLLLTDIPGVKVKSTLIPGASVGTSDLIIALTPGPRVTGNIEADNAGNLYTGANRIGATVNLNNPTGQGDMATLRALTAGTGMRYARAAYQTQFNQAKIGIAYSNLEYSLGRDFVTLRVYGNAEIVSIYGSYPLIRSRDNNLYLQLAYDAKSFQDKVDSTLSITDKQSHVFMTSMSGDHRDRLGRGGLTSYSLTWSAGNSDIKTPSVLSIDQASAQTQGQYHKLGLSFMRLQRVTESISIYALLNGQFSSKNLDVSEKMELGGMYAVRAYPEGETFADQGYVLNLEARTQLPEFSPQWGGQMQLIGFVDTGTVSVNKHPWSVGTNSRTLSGAGVGLNWTGSDNVVVKAYYARKLGNEQALSVKDSSSRFWLQAVKAF
jgi:hemolysin activation/secretion protein